MPWKKAYHRLKMESVTMSQVKNLPTPPPAKKSKIVYEDDSDDDVKEVNECDNPLDLKWKLFYSKI